MTKINDFRKVKFYLVKKIFLSSLKKKESTHIFLQLKMFANIMQKFTLRFLTINLVSKIVIVRIILVFEKKITHED